MVRLFGTEYARDELLQHVGSIEQIAGVRFGELADGFERGVRVADVYTGSGFAFTILLDRGMDIGPASFCGAPLAWRSATTAKAPSYYEPAGLGWLRGFHGGLLNTCGLTYFGAPTQDQGQALGLHGRASYTPASNIAYGGCWEGDTYELWCSGELREAVVFGENLVLRRHIRARLGESRLIIEDEVTNEGYAPTPHMMLYHVNFGFPVVAKASELLAASRKVHPRDAAAAAGLEHHRRFEAPTPGYAEQVFYHTLAADADGYAQVAVVNRTFGGGRGLGGYVRYRVAELPYLVQWKMMGQGTYVCGLEPATNWVEGRAKERSEGRLVELAPGEVRRYRVEIGVLGSPEAIAAFAASLP